ncbi:Monoacylglycerol lipase [Pandoraea terrae]|uniref:Monoacylglycerol lipase n=1 Tax=Pandoraea terrae TaxID=1537710 RepID=A0A5E4RKG2_9BURK|nr:alpha/beta hydrolase [Pandoraea terrae]VVD63004.1 Monoacylglycerol lipase [Pandoraea terrae]
MTLHTESRLDTCDGQSLYVQGWRPNQRAPRAVVAIIHGMGEHGGRYRRLAEHFATHDLATVTFDLRGHGLSSGARVFVNRFDDYLGDTDIFLTHVRSTFGPTPVFLLGHSMGGAIAALYAITRQPDVRGLALSSPALAPGEPVPPWLLTLGRWVARWLPRVPVYKIDPARIARDQTVVEEARRDPLNVYRGTPARTAAELLSAMARIHTGADALRLPLYIFHGTEDRLTAPYASEQLHASAASTDKTLRMYRGHYHETLNDLDRETVIRDLTQWLLHHLPAVAARRDHAA